MNCPNCNNQINDDTSTCPSCGAIINSSPNPNPNQNPNTGPNQGQIVEQQPVQPQSFESTQQPNSVLAQQPAPTQPLNSNQSSSNKRKIFIIAAIALLIIIVIIGVVLLSKNNKPDHTDNNIDQQSKEDKKEEKTEEADSSEEDDEDSTSGRKRTSIKTDYGTEGPFLMAIEDVFAINGIGTVATGKINRGVIHVNDEVELTGFGESRKLVVSAIRVFREPDLESAEAGMNIGLVFKDIDRSELQRGQVFSEPGSTQLIKVFKAKVYIHTKMPSSSDTPLHDGDKIKCYFFTENIDCEVSLPDDVSAIGLEETVDDVVIKLESSQSLEPGFEFIVRKEGNAIGRGIITAVSNDIE